MLLQKSENIFDLYLEALVHPINCIGISHDMLSKKIKKTWPDYYREYVRACMKKKLQPYTVYHFNINTLFGTSHILPITIRYSWQERLKEQKIDTALDFLIEKMKKNGISEIAIPYIEGIEKKEYENMLNLKAKTK